MNRTLPSFYGWRVVAAAFVLLALASGVVYSFPAYYAAFQADFGATRPQVALVFSLSQVVLYGLGLFIGTLVQQLGLRRMLALGVLLVTLGMAGASMARSIHELMAAYCLGVGAGVSFLYVPSVAVVQRWFVRRRGFASGIAVAGIGFGTFLFPLLAARLTGDASWRASHLAMAAILLVLGLAAAWVVRSSPADLGLSPDGVPGGDAPKALSGEPLSAALRSFDFYLLYVASFGGAASLFFVLLYLPQYASNAGTGTMGSIGLTSLLGLSSVAGRFLFGHLSDSLGRQRMLAIVFAGMSGACALWLTELSGYALLVTVAVLFGAFYGGYIALLPAVTADRFGPLHITHIVGVLYTSAGIAAVVASVGGAAVLDAISNYSQPIAAAAILCLLAACCAWAVGVQRLLPAVGLRRPADKEHPS